MLNALKSINLKNFEWKILNEYDLKKVLMNLLKNPEQYINQKYLLCFVQNIRITEN